jgi:DNA-binding transcriptional regulator YhcF (GntR family)
MKLPVSVMMTQSDQSDQVDRLSDVPASEQLAAMFKRWITDHENTPPESRLYHGQKFPSVNRISERYGVARNTAARVQLLLKQDDLIEVTPSAGSKVIYHP